jgi:hypothetical protein
MPRDTSLASQVVGGTQVGGSNNARVPISKFMPSDGCKGDTVPLVVER